jgi:hypothetical protein
MRKVLLSTILSIAIFAMSMNASAQERPYRIGLKLGIPQIVGLNLEYVTPIK